MQEPIEGTRSGNRGNPATDQSSDHPDLSSNTRFSIEEHLVDSARRLSKAVRNRDWDAATLVLYELDNDPAISMEMYQRVVNAEYKRGRLTAVHFAAMYNAPDRFMDVLLPVYPDFDKGGSIIRRMDRVTVRDQTALHIALECGYLTVATRIMEAGARLDLQNSLGETPLHSLCKAVAAGKANEEQVTPVIKAMLHMKPPLEVRDATGKHLLSQLTEANLFSITSLIVREQLQRAQSGEALSINRQELQEAMVCTLKYEPEASSLLPLLHKLYERAQHGPLTIPDSNNLENLIASVVPDSYNRLQWMHVEDFLTLVQQSPCPFPDEFVDSVFTARNSKGEQLLHILAQTSAPAQVVAKALDLGADTAATCYVTLPVIGPVGGFTPLHLAVQSGNFACANELLRRGAAVDAENELGETPLDGFLKLAPDQRKPEMLGLLLHSGSEISDKNRDKITLLLYTLADGDFTALKAYAAIAPVLPKELQERKFQIFKQNEKTEVDYLSFVEEITAVAVRIGVEKSEITRLLWAHLGTQLAVEDQEAPAVLPNPNTPISEEEIVEILGEPYGMGGMLGLMIEAGEFVDALGGDILAAIGSGMIRSGALGAAHSMLEAGGSLNDVYNLFRTLVVARDISHGGTLAGGEGNLAFDPPDFPLTKLLQPLLFRYEPGTASIIANAFEQVMDRSSSARAKHPYIAELMALLNHPRDAVKSDRTIGALTSSLSSVTRFNEIPGLFVSGQTAYDWGRIGTLAFSFPRWRFDCEGHLEVSNDGEKSFSRSLLEMAGFRRVLNRESDVVIDAKNGKEKQYLGRGFVLLPGSKLNGGYWKPDTEGGTRHVPIAPDTVVELRRAYLLVSNNQGTLLIRNSSTVFGRDTFAYPAYFSKKGYKAGMEVQELLSLTPDNLKRFGFKQILDTSLYSDSPVGFGRYHTVHSGHSTSARKIEHLLDQLQTVLEGYSHWKFDSNFHSAWDREKTGEEQLIGGYRSPGFKRLVSFLERRFEEVQMDTLIHGRAFKQLPDLAIARSEFVPWVPDQRLEVTEDVLGALRHLAQHGMREFGAFAETGVRDFVNLAMQQQGEIVLLAPEKKKG